LNQAEEFGVGAAHGGGGERSAGPRTTPGGLAVGWWGWGQATSMRWGPAAVFWARENSTRRKPFR
jgi:hypothetical protein